MLPDDTDLRRPFFEGVATGLLFVAMLFFPPRLVIQTVAEAFGDEER